MVCSAAQPHIISHALQENVQRLHCLVLHIRAHDDLYPTLQLGTAVVLCVLAMPPEVNSASVCPQLFDVFFFNAQIGVMHETSFSQNPTSFSDDSGQCLAINS